jgi:hypothetical protein
MHFFVCLIVSRLVDNIEFFAVSFPLDFQKGNCLAQQLFFSVLLATKKQSFKAQNLDQFKN